jgi:hypothetical protein
MTRQEVLQSLFAARRDIENRLMDLAPQGDTTKIQQFRDLARKRDQIVETINSVIAADFQGVVNSEIDTALKTLAAQVDGLAGIANAFANVNEVISIVDQVIQTTAQIVAKVGAVAA